MSFREEAYGTVGNGVVAKAYTDNAAKKPDICKGETIVSNGANSDTYENEPARAAGFLGRGKLMSSNTTGGSEEFMSGSAIADGKFAEGFGFDCGTAP